jgi:hypothetical protein
MHYKVVTTHSINQAKLVELHTFPDKKKAAPDHIFLGIYRRPGYDADFIPNFREIYDQIQHEHPLVPVTIVGDLNLDLFKITHKLHDFLLETGLHTTITTPTRYEWGNTPLTSTLIDVVMTTMTHTPVTAGTYSSPISDHLPIYAIFHTPTKRRPKNKTKTLSRAREIENPKHHQTKHHRSQQQLPGRQHYRQQDPSSPTSNKTSSRTVPSSTQTKKATLVHAKIPQTNPKTTHTPPTRYHTTHSPQHHRTHTI